MENYIGKIFYCQSSKIRRRMKYKILFISDEESRKKVSPLVVRPLRGGGPGKGCTTKEK